MHILNLSYCVGNKLDFQRILFNCKKFGVLYPEVGEVELIMMCLLHHQIDYSRTNVLCKLIQLCVCMSLTHSHPILSIPKRKDVASRQRRDTVLPQCASHNLLQITSIIRKRKRTAISLQLIIVASSLHAHSRSWQRRCVQSALASL